MKKTQSINSLKLPYFFWAGFLLCFFFFGKMNAQEVSSSVDTTTIKIGEQIKYAIQVQAAASDLVVFPEEESFLPLEMVEASEIDTTSEKNNFRLLREYALTQFDSGTYTIPRQKIIINEKAFYTDSLQIEVKDVVVDTTQQKMFPIKPSVTVKEKFSIPNWVWWVIGILAVVGLLAFLLLRRKKKIKEAKENLPPYEKAKLSLKQLDESHVLETGSIKEYYSGLSFTIKQYIDEKIDDRALESTTEELITRLKLLKNSNKLYLKESVLQGLEVVLKRADLAKFAGVVSDKITAKADRKVIEDEIDEFDKAIPEPTEEELQKNLAYQEEERRKRKKRRIILGSIAGAAAIFISLAVLVGVKGLDYSKDLIFGNASKELLQGDWINSEYGNPQISVTTPEVLVRKTNKFPKKMQEAVQGAEQFEFGSLTSDYYASLSTMQYVQGKEFDLQKSLDLVYEELEEKGGYNILMKDEKYETPEGAKGIEITGTFIIENPVTKTDIKKEYMILNFGEKGGFQQILLIYNPDDEYAEEISGRIINSVEFNKTPN